MTPEDIKQALAGMAATLRQNPELMKQQIAMFTQFFPDADEATLKTLIEKAAQPNFNPRALQQEVENLVSAVKSRTQKSD
jgi:pyrroloquinoline quinone (PQQ) biosynthesis protein C